MLFRDYKVFLFLIRDKRSTDICGFCDIEFFVTFTQCNFVSGLAYNTIKKRYFVILSVF